MMGFLIEVGWKSALCAGVTVGLLRLLQRRSAAEQSLVATLGLFALLLLPLTVLMLPEVEISAPAPMMEALAGLSTELTPVPELTESSPVQAPIALDWERLAAALYLLPAGGLLLLLLLGVLRLQQIRARANVLVDPRWVTALAAAQQRFGLKHGTALLSSTELNSPISWGVVRPIIIIDPLVARAVDQAEAIIAHELAHVDRMDWLKLLVGRLATALLWFNPLVWLLARRSYQLCEEAADDTVLRGKVNDADYAQLLVKAVRHANGSALLAANGVAPCRSSIAQRVDHVLDRTKPRSAARLTWLATLLPAAVAVTGALAAAEPTIFAPARYALDAEAGEQAAARLVRIHSIHTHALASAIRNADWNARRVAGNTIFHQPAAVEPLLLALRDERPVVRRIALWGLSEIRPTVGSSAASSVARLLSDRSAEVRGEAVRALGDFGSVAFSNEIAGLLGDADPRVRQQAAHALGDLQNPRSRAALEAASLDPDPGVRNKVHWALQQISDAEAVLDRYSGG